MLRKTRGIVLSFVKYRETSIIVRIFTDQFGVQSYIENGVRSSKGKNKIALFQPLTLLDLVVYHDDKKDLHRISEIRCLHPFTSLPYEVSKSCVGIFMAEVLHKTLKEHTENVSLFEFIHDAVIQLDQQKEGFENFHLHFLIQYSLYLGFTPHSAEEIFEQLDALSVPYVFNAQTAEILNDMIVRESGLENRLSRKTRSELLDILLLFYRIHIEDFGELRSLPVLKEVLA